MCERISRYLPRQAGSAKERVDLQITMSVLGAVCHDLRDTPRRKPFVVAEEVGFEPTVAVTPRRCSRPFHSSALAPFRLKVYRHYERLEAKNSFNSAADSSASSPCSTGGL